MSKKGKKEAFFPVEAVPFSNLVQYSIFFEIYCMLFSCLWLFFSLNFVRDSNPDYRLPKVQEQSDDLIG